MYMVAVVCITTGDKHNTEDFEDEQDDDDDAEESVPIENESYVNFRKRMEKKSEARAEEVLQENKKLCREFRRKPVTAFISDQSFFTHLTNFDRYREFISVCLEPGKYILYIVSLLVFQVLCVNAGTEGQTACVG